MIYANYLTIDSDSEIGSEKSVYGNVVRPSNGSSIRAYLNVVCVIAGTGILGLPMALRLGGWIGLLILALAWGMSIYTSILLIRCLYANEEKRLSTYKDVATEAFGAIGGWVTFFFNAWILLGGPILYLVLAGQNLNQLCQGTSGELGDVPWIIICTVIVAIPLVLFKTMKDIAWVSALGFVAITIVVLVVLIMSIIDKPNQIDVQHDVVIWNMFPIALSTIAFSFGGNAVFPNIEASMKKPQDWNKVATAGISTCALLYFAVAICGYLVYGTIVQSPIYNSLPEGAGRIVAIIVVTINVMTSTPIFAASFALDIEEMFNITIERFGKVKEFAIRCLVRILIIGFICLIACVVPHFGALMSLIGAFGNCTLIFIFPVVFYFKLTGFRNKPYWEYALSFFVILLGIVGLVFGTIEAIKELIAAFSA